MSSYVGHSKAKFTADINVGIFLVGILLIALFSTPVTAITVPAKIVAFVPITFNNSQSLSLPSNSQIPIFINASKYSNYYTCNLNNAEFFYSNGTIAYSWLEGNVIDETTANGLCSSSSSTDSLVDSTNVLYWIGVNGAFLLSRSSNTIYLGWAGNYLSSSNTLFSNRTGEAPQLSCLNPNETTSCNYGEYDNGHKIFTFYDNFAGSVLSANWTKYTERTGFGSTVSVSNGLIEYAKGTGGEEITVAGIATTNANTINTNIPSYYLDYLVGSASGDYNSNFTALTSGFSSARGYITGVPYDCGADTWNGYCAKFDGYSYPGTLYSSDSDLYRYIYPHVPINSSFVVYMGVNSTTSGTQNVSVTVNNEGSNTFNNLNQNFTAFNYIYIGTGGQAYDSDIVFDWVRLTSYPPNDIQPSIYIGNIVSSPYIIPILISNNQASATGANFQQLISFNALNYQSMASNNLGSMRFFQGSNELYSWCELGCNSISSNSIFWIKIPAGIPASSNVIINMTFLPITTNYDGIYAGEAPQQSITGYNTIAIKNTNYTNQTQTWVNAPPSSNPFTFATTSNSFVVLVLTCGGFRCTSASLTGGLGSYCGYDSGSLSHDVYESAEMWVCNTVPAGSDWGLTATGGNFGSATAEAYIYNNQTNVTFPIGYGKYDNGNYVFNYYNDFLNSTNINGWGNGNSTSFASNGLTVTCNSGSSYNFCGVGSNTVYSAPFIEETYVPSAIGPYGISGLSPSTVLGSGVVVNAIGILQGGQSTPFGGYYYATGGFTNLGTCGSGYPSNGIVQVTVSPANTLKVSLLTLGEQSHCSLSTETNLAAGPYHLLLGGNDNQPDGENVTWVRLRVVPPNGIMPSVVFGTLS